MWKAAAQMETWDLAWKRQLEATRQKALADRQAAQAQAARIQLLDGKRMAAEQKRVEKDICLAEANERTREAQQQLDDLASILAHTLTMDDAIDWESLKDTTPFATPCPIAPAIPPEPDRQAPQYQPRRDVMAVLLRSKRAAAEEQAQALYGRDRDEWARLAEGLTQNYQQRLAAYVTERDAFLEQQRQRNHHMDEQRAEYLARNPESIVDYCDLVLARSEYPSSFPTSFELDYLPESMTLVVDYQLPSLEQMPRLKEVKYLATRGEFKESFITESQVNTLYDSVVYQITLRTVHEIFEADRVGAIDAIVLNGWVTALDPGTGQDKTACILSLHTSKDQFMTINLARIDPHQCFRGLKGVGSSKLHSLTPIAPILEISREDRRFVQAYDVASKLDEGSNLAAMDWEDFEHLIREVFEKGFAQGGGEVKVTQASRDGGVDAVAFDPDPIRGGKIVIQAKRYTHTVGVSAVRDLYGTVMNEGATKGILVTTSDYGPDAFEFAKGKPITLLSGGNLLHLLSTHGYKARIDLAEARQLQQNG